MEQTDIFCETVIQKNSNTVVKHDTMKFLSLLLDDIRPNELPIKLKPSTYTQEMILRTEERLESFMKTLKFPLKKDLKHFKVTPPLIVFQNFESGKQYNATFSIRNISEVSKQITVKSKPSEVFSINYSSKVIAKLAPGMSLHFNVRFSPQVEQDQKYTVTIETDNGSFDVPFIALASRPLVNFPDFIELGETLVRVPCKKSIYVRNIGKIPAIFNLSCENPFSVSPDRCVLDIGEMSMITVTFEPSSAGDFFKDLSILFETGEELHIDLTGFSNNGTIWLSSDKLCMDDTYVGLKQQQVVSLINDSDSTIQFSWNKFETLQTDLDELDRMKQKFIDIKDFETTRCNKLEYNEMITETDNSKVYSRILADEMSSVSINDLHFSNKNFEIFPIEGELWPRGKCNITVTFTPEICDEFSCTAFCDVTGKDTRLPLHLNGHGLGPRIKLNLRSLDIGPVFLGSHQSYEIIAANKGDIPGSLHYVAKQTFFGGTILCEPLCQCLEPYDVKSFIISFSSSRTGSFVEELAFKISQSGEELQISLKGCVVNPVISFDQLKLDFGTVPIGFPVTRNVNLINQSQVPVTFALRVSSDGNIIPITCDDFALTLTDKPSIKDHCREFTLFPVTGTIEPNSETTIEVVLVTNTARKNICSLVVENKNSKLSEPVSLMISYESRVADVVCNPLDITIRFCFVNFEYSKQISLCNSSDIPAYFYIPPQKTCSDYNIRYKTDVSEGLLGPGETRQITFNIEPLYVGRIKQDVMMILFGKRDPYTVCTISCTAQGPNVSSNIETLNFGKLTLMETKTLHLDLSNDSPIAAQFTISADEKHQAMWTIEPVQGELLPGQMTTVSVTLTVVDPGVINNILTVQVENSRPVTIGLLASASGCGILIYPTIFPQLDLQYLFSRRLHQFTLTLHNPGSRHHLIQFTSDRTSLKSNMNLVTVNIIKFTPPKFELEGGQKTQVILEVQCNKEMEVVENFVCWAVINKKGLKQKLGDITIKANFTAPVLELSQDLLEFEINVGPNEQQGQISTKELKLRSVANLPLTLILELNNPFLILEDEFTLYTESLINLNPEEEETIMIGFKPPLQQNLQSSSYSGVLHITYREHPQKDKVQLKGHLNFPNLQFSQRTLDFGCTPLDYQKHEEIILVNPTPLPVTFSFAWDPNSVLTTYFEQENIEDLLGADLPETLKFDPLHFNRLLGSMKGKDSMTGPLPLIYVEPVPVHPATFPSVVLDELINSSVEDNEIHDVLFPIVEPYFSPEQPPPEFNMLPAKSPTVHEISEVFDLAPMFGTLTPHQSLALNVSFHPRAFMGAAVTAVCTVLGGPTETVRLSGQSARHIFSLSTTFINFGFRSFMEPCEEVIRLKNLSPLPFSFKISSLCSLTFPEECNDLEMGKILVEPSFGEVASQSSVNISVKFYPGLAGEFQESFAVQIGYLESVTVVVTGYGVMPQIFVNNLTMSRAKVPVSWLYSAVASLTSERFLHLVHGRITPDMTITDDYLHGWLLIDYSDRLPSNEDIYLALERVIAHQYVKENTLHPLQILKTYSKTIPQLQVPGYILDFGSVVIGTTTEMTMMVENRGFVRADVHLSLGLCEKKLKQDGVSVLFQNNVSLAVGRSVPLFVTIKSTPQRFKNTRELIHFTMQLKVIGGASVPIYCKALLTVPHIQLDQKIVSFGDVRCGQCMKKCILLKNSGEIEAEWNATLFRVKRRGKELPEPISPFQISQTNGLFPPKTACYLEISFTPFEEKAYEYMLKLSTMHNAEKILARLYGSGVEPKVVISPTTVQFGAHIPYSTLVARDFTISNPCPFDIQLYFPDFDSKIIEEERILRVLMHLYHSDKMLLPLDVYNTEALSELRNLYKELTDEARKTVRSAVIEASSQFSNSECSNGKKHRPSSNKSVKDHLKSESGTSTMPSRSIFHPSFDPFAYFSSDDIEHRIHDLIEESDTNKEEFYDPLNLKERTTPQPPHEAKDPNKGILLVFHGAPKSDHVFWANRTGKHLSLTINTLDELILQEAATSFTPAANTVQEAINNAFSQRTESGGHLSQTGTVMNYEELQDRVKQLKEPPQDLDASKAVGIKKGTKANSSKTTPRPGTSKSKGNPTNNDLTDTFENISVSVFVDLLENRLLHEVENGLVLESLTGFFLKSIKSAATVILKCVGHIICLQFFTISRSVDEYRLWERKCLRIKDTRKIEDDKDKVLIFEKMTMEELDEISAADKQLFLNTLLHDKSNRYNAMRTKRENIVSNMSPTLKKEDVEPKSTGTAKSKETKTNKSKKEKSMGKKSTDDKSAKGSSKSKKQLIKPQGKSDEDSNLEDSFAAYERELADLVLLLSRWNIETEDFEDLERPSSLMKTSKPQSRKQNRRSIQYREKNSINISAPAKMGVSCNIMKYPLNPSKVNWFEGLIQYLSTIPQLLDSKKVEKEWNDLPQPDALTLSLVVRPAERIQDPNLHSFFIKDSNGSDLRINRFHLQTLEKNISDKSVQSDQFGKKERDVSNESSSTDTEEIFSKADSFESTLSLQQESLVNHGEEVVKADQLIRTSQQSQLQALEQNNYTTNINLRPGRSWIVFFEPRDLAYHKKEVWVEVGGWRKRYKLLLEAICDIPRVDSNPRSMFEQVQETLSVTNISQCVYLLDKHLFYFGPVFATLANETRTNDVSTNFYFKNVSEVEAKVDFEFVNGVFSSSENIFGFKPNHLFILPGDTQILEVFASPRIVGKYTETLVYTIKNNPQPGFIKLSCFGVRAEFEFEPKVLSFERVLLYRKELCQLTLINKSYKPLGWRLVDLPLLSPQITVSQKTGVVPALQNTNVYFNFRAEYVEVSNCIVYIEVFDDQFRGQPFLSEPIQVNMESVDVLVDVIFPKATSSEVKFDAVKVGEPESQNIILKNVGKYDVTFQIKFNDAVEVDFDLSKVFTFTPKSGNLPKSGKPVNVKISCMCEQAVHINKLPLLKVWVVDSSPLSPPVAAIPVNVTINAFSSQFLVTPESEINFGPLIVGAKANEILTIQNTGKFEFYFSIVTLEQDQLEQIEAKQKKEKEKGNVNSKGTSLKSSKDGKSGKKDKLTNKGKPVVSKKGGIEWPSLTAGVFTLSQSGGRLQPGESLAVNICCEAPAQDHYSQVIVIKLLDLPHMKGKGTNIKLSCSAFLPFIDFSDVSYIFQEVLGLPFVPGGEDGLAHCSYDPAASTLRFENVCVGTEHSLNVHLRNRGLIPCEVKVSTTPGSEFCVSPPQFTILSHSETSFRVTFLPTKIGIFSETLLVQVELPSPLAPQTLTTNLIGEASLPHIQVLHPPSLSSCDPLPSPHTLEFPPTLIGESSLDNITFFNSSRVSCRVTIEILENKEQLFMFSLFDPVKSFCKDIHSVQLACGERCEIVVKFCPQFTTPASCQVRLYVNNNPYEDQTIFVRGVGYFPDIVLHGLPLAHSISDIHTSTELLVMKYRLLFPPCVVNNAVTRLCTMKNQTEHKCYRFEWTECEDVSVSPSLGHLSAGSSKEIIFTFHSDQPLTVLDNKPMICELTQIHLKDKGELLSWDNCQKSVKWIENTESESKSVGRINRQLYLLEEPEYEVMSDSNLSLSVLVSAQADVPHISCSRATVHFPPTIVSQVEVCSMTLVNTSMVPAVYEWQVEEQSRDCEDDEVDNYQAITMSNERPRLRLVSTRSEAKKETSSRPATCPHVRPAPIPSSVNVFSLDDSLLTKISNSRSKSRSFTPLVSEWPISVNPVFGEIEPGKEILCHLEFKPHEFSKYSCKLKLRVKNTQQAKLPELVIPVYASSKLPCCHLVVSDCVPTSQPERLQINFRVLGIGKPTYKCVTLVNTSSEDYSFHLQQPSADTLSPFACNILYSQLRAGKYLEVTFSFLPYKEGTVESTWQLYIPDRNVRQNIKLVGVSSEPNVSLVPTFLQLSPTLIGVRSKGKVTLMNQELCDLSFKVDPNSLFCGSWSQTLDVQPMKGIIPAQGHTDLKVCLTPSQAGSGGFQVHISVQKMQKVFMLNITASCYQVRPLLVFNDLRKVCHEMATDTVNHIDLGAVESRMPVPLTFSMTNIGKPAFHYHWVWDRDTLVASQLSVTAANMSGVVGSQSKHSLELQVTPLARTHFTNIQLKLVISKGPTYVVALSGSSAQARFRFSFDKYKFGTCFVQSSNTEFNQTTLVFTNTDEKPLLVEKERGSWSHLKVGLTQATVEPRSELHIPFTFLPRECQDYSNSVLFLVDGSHRHSVLITGRGVEIHVALLDSKDSLVSLDGVRVNHTKKKNIHVVNRSVVCAADVLFTLEPPVPELSLTPVEPVNLQPQHPVSLNLKYSPTNVVKDIRQQIYYQFQDTKRVLAVITASSFGISVKLDREFIPFGSTVFGNTSTSKIMLLNNGDLSIKFKWFVPCNDFKITPAEGFCAAGSDCLLTVTYSPKKLEAGSHCKAVCEVLNYEQLSVELTGRCVDLPPVSETVSLSCPVRQTSSTQIALFNKLGQSVTVTASISGEYFSGDKTSLIPAYGTHLFPLNYSPLNVTTSGNTHKGTVVFYFPDGSCLVYLLEGKAEPPVMSGQLQSQVYTHTPHTLPVPVTNWLPVKQRFRVKCTLESSSSPDPRYRLDCNEYLILSGSQSRDLLLTLTCHFPATLKFKVLLENEWTGEFAWYEVMFDVLPCPSLGDIHLTSTVRTPVYHELQFVNPLDSSVTVECVSDTDTLSVTNTQPLSILPHDHGTLNLKYLPVLVEDTRTHTLELTSPQLGLFPYQLFLTALPPPPTPPLYLTCNLGFVSQGSITLSNVTTHTAVFHCSSSHEDAVVEPSVSVPSGASKTVQITYQPSSLENIAAEIIASSSQAGDFRFRFQVVGTCKLPEPRGPYTLHSGSGIILTIKNVFKESKTFVWSVNNPAFSVKNNEQLLEPKQVAEIEVDMVALQDVEFEKFPVTGKLVVNVTDPRLCHVKWVFYLNGLPTS